jgi:hypothetical protein
MKDNSLENYLADKHAEDYIGFDDDMPDAFNEWITNLDVEEWLMYSKMWASSLLDQLKGTL